MDYDRRNNRDRRDRGFKRRRDDEDDFHYSPRDARRARHDREPPHEKLRGMLTNIASSTKLPQDETIEIAEFLAKHWDDEQTRTEFRESIVSLIFEQPFKIPFIAAVTFYGNRINGEIAAAAVKDVGEWLQIHFDKGEWKELKLYLRFLACLQPLFKDDGVFTFLGQLFDTTVDLQSANENDVVGIELVKIILLTIPYAIATSGTRFHDKAQELLNSTGVVAGNVLPMANLILPFDSADAEQLSYHHSAIGLLQEQLVQTAEQGWKIACIPTVDPEAVLKPNGDNPLPAELPTHAFPTFVIPSPVNTGPEPLFPEAYFSLFAGQDIKTVPQLNDLAASLIRDATVDTIDQLQYNRMECAKSLVDIDSYWSVDVFAKRGIPLDKFRDAVGDKISYKSEDMIIDALFSQLFRLPAVDWKCVYYHALIVECCKIAPAAIAPSLGRAIRTVYKNLHAIDLELGYRFLDWFTHHISNFEFRWRWTEWIVDVELSDLHPKKAFIIAALDKEIRLSFAKRIRTTLPQEMHLLIPTRLDDDNSPAFKYDKPETPYGPEGQTLLQQLRKKATYEEIQKTIEKIHDQAREQGVSDVLVPSTDAFTTAICRLGSKSLSHVLSCIERNKDHFLAVAQESESARRQIITSVVDYWHDQPGVAVRIVDMLLNYTILAPMTVIQWVFGDFLGAGKALAQSWVFEMVSSTMSKVTNRNRQIASARVQKGLPQEQVDMVEATLSKDRDNARELFRCLEDSLRGIAEGSADRLIEEETNGSLTSEDAQLIRAWAKRWHTVFVRKAAVEEAVVGEEAVEARVKLAAALPGELEAMDMDTEAKETNGQDDMV